MPSRSSLSASALLLGLVAATTLSGKEIALRRPFVPGQPPEPAKTLSDAEALTAAKLKADSPDSLLGYFRQRTVSDTDLVKIQSAIKRLGTDEFDDRLKAADQVELYGPAAIGPLRTAAQSAADPEVAYRAMECLKRLEKVPHSTVAAAAVRALAKLKPDGTADVLLGFLPLADNQAVADEIGKTLAAVAYKNGKADVSLVSALTDTVALRRGAAAVALVEGAPAGDKPSDVFPKVLKAGQAEPDQETKFRILFALTAVGKDKDAVTSLIDMLADLPRGRLWQAEDYLLQLAGKDAPAAQFKRTKESLTKAQDVWKKWWDGARAKTDLAAFKYAERITGKTVLLMSDNSYGNGQVVELGPDMKERWKITGLMTPNDIVFLPNNQVMISETNANRVTIRDMTGRVVANRTLNGAGRKIAGGQPISLQLLDNGNLIVGCRNGVFEFKKDTDEVVNSYARNQYDIQACHRLPNGQTLLLASNDPKFSVFLDEKLAEIPNKKLGVQAPHWQAQMAATGPDTVLIGEQQQLAEYSVKDNKVIWKKQVFNARSPQRLPNGNTLFVDQQNRLIEVAPDGEEVWSYQAPANMMLSKAVRR